MSRRCEREGKPQPRRGWTAEGCDDAVLGRQWLLTFMLGAYSPDEVRHVRADDHERVMINLCERVVLP